MVSLSLQRATVKYQAVTALDGLSIDIGSGESVAITGPSGSGKTTALELLSGITTPTSGIVRVGGDEIQGLGDAERTQMRASLFGFVYQDYGLLPYLTALENVEISWRLRPGGLTPESAIEIVGLDRRKRHLPAELSGGEQQRVSIARAMCGSPEVIVADEPTGALDSKTGLMIVDELARLSVQQGVTVVIVTHDELVAERMGRTVRLVDGRLAGGDS